MSKMSSAWCSWEMEDSSQFDTSRTSLGHWGCSLKEFVRAWALSFSFLSCLSPEVNSFVLLYSSNCECRTKIDIFSLYKLSQIFVEVTGKMLQKNLSDSTGTGIGRIGMVQKREPVHWVWGLFGGRSDDI